MNAYSRPTNVAESKLLHNDKLVSNKIMGIANGAYIIAFYILVYSVTLVTRILLN